MRKKTKLLCVLTALVFVLSLNSCEQTEDVLTSDELESSIENDSYEDSKSESYGESDSNSGQVQDDRDWDSYPPESLSELIEKAYITGNYSVQIQYDAYRGSNTISYAEYNAARAGDEEAYEKYQTLFDEDSIYCATSYLTNIYYDTDYILVEDYELAGETYYLDFMDVIVNDSDNTFWEYVSTDGYNWDGYHYYLNWETYYYSLNYAYENDIANYFTEVFTQDWTTGYEIGGNIGYYPAAACWFACLGLDWIFGNYVLSYGTYYFNHYITYYDAYYERARSYYYYDGLFYDNTYDSEGNLESVTDDTQLYYMDYELSAIIYDVGDTDQSEIVYYYHNALQGFLE